MGILFDYRKHAKYDIRSIEFRGNTVDVTLEGDHTDVARVAQRYAHQKGYHDYVIKSYALHDATRIELPLKSGLLAAIQGACEYLKRL